MIFITAARVQGWHVDSTYDLARILRVPRTLNHKFNPPKEVEPALWQPNRRYSQDDLECAIAEAHANLSEHVPSFVPLTERRKRLDSDFSASSGAAILKGCKFLKHCAENAETLPEPHWYKILTIIARTELGRDLCHDLSMPHPCYSEAETDRKIDHALNDSGPFTCQKIQQDHGDEWCSACPYNGNITSPIQIGTRKKDGKQNLVVSENLEQWRELVAQTGIYQFRDNGLEEITVKLVGRGPEKEPKQINVLLSNFVARPIREIVEDNGIEKTFTFEIAGMLHDGRMLPTIKVPADTFHTMSWISISRGMNAVLEPGTAKKDKVRHAAQLIGRDIPRQTI